MRITSTIKNLLRRIKQMSFRLKISLAVIAVITVALVGLGAMGAMLWSASDQLLSPSFRAATNDFVVCKPETAQYWGQGCGNLRTTKQFAFDEVSIPSVNGYTMPGWLVKADGNGEGPARGAIMLVRTGGTDRREQTRYIKFLLDQKLDVLTFDQICQGEAARPTPGLTYGTRESKDVLSAYLYLANSHDKVYAMGSSVGAASILIALPDMPKLAGAIVENPMASFERLIKEAPEAKSMPTWMSDALINLAMTRGKFDGLLSAEHSLPLAKDVPVFFIHSKADKVASYKNSEDLAALYKGPKAIWLPERGNHAEIWDVDHAIYEQRVSGFLNSTH